MTDWVLIFCRMYDYAPIYTTATDIRRYSRNFDLARIDLASQVIRTLRKYRFTAAVLQSTV